MGDVMLVVSLLFPLLLLGLLLGMERVERRLVGGSVGARTGEHPRAAGPPSRAGAAPATAAVPDPALRVPGGAPGPAGGTGSGPAPARMPRSPASGVIGTGGVAG